MAVFCGFWRKFRHLVLVSMLCIGALFSTKFFAFDDLNPVSYIGYPITYYDGNTQMTPGPGWPIDYGRFDTNINLPNPTKSHYIFVGWCLNSSTCSESSRLMGTVSTSVFGGNKSARLYAQWEQGDFRITTTSMPANSDFQFHLSAMGTFTVDCGNGGVLSGAGVSGTTITRSDTNSNPLYACGYLTGGIKKITFSGVATGYRHQGSTLDATISFSDESLVSTGTYVASVSGDMSAVFPYLGSNYSQKPDFYKAFSNASNLISVSGSLFQGYNTADISFFGVFDGCTSLTSIPEDLFANMSGGDFRHAFIGCTSLTSIPSGLFSHMTTGTFTSAFQGCTGLTSLPSSLFAGITNAIDKNFNSTFAGCSNLTGFIPPTLFEGLINNGSPNNSTFMNSIFANDSNLLTSCPANYYQYITGYESDWDGHVSCKPCPSGTTSPAGSTSINQCVYTITYNNGASSGMTVSNMPNPSSVSVAYGTSYTLASAPTSNGYTFAGWNCPGLPGTTGQNGYFSAGYSYVFNKSATCTAKWAVQHNITYLCGNGATGNGFTDPLNYLSDRHQTIRPNSNCSKTGAAFTGWICDRGAGYAVVHVAPGDYLYIPDPEPDNIVCTANWMDMNCGTGGTVWVDPMWTEFIGDLTPGTDYYPNTTVSIISGGSVRMTSLCSSTPGTIINTPSNNVSNNQGGYCWCRITGYTPDGGSFQSIDGMPWVYEGNFNNYATCVTTYSQGGGEACAHQCNKYVLSSLTAQTGVLTRYACGYTVNLDSGTGMESRSTSVYTIEGVGVYKDRARTQSMTPLINNVAPITRQGNYDFDGYWGALVGGTQYINASGFINNDGINAGKALTSNTSWYAHWTPFYTIAYYNRGTELTANNGLPSGAPTTYYDGTASLTLPTLSNETGYIFNGWCDGSQTCNNTLSGNVNTSGWTGDKTLIAQWTCDTTNDYYWDGNNCVKGYTITLRNNSASVYPPDTTHSPSTLYTIYGMGAYLDAARTQLMTTSTNSITMPTKTVTILQDANAPTNPVNNTPYSIPVSASTDVPITYGNFVTGSNIVTIDKNTGLITADGDNIAKNLTDDVTWNITSTAYDNISFPVPSLPGYTFDGWYGNVNGTGSSYTRYSSSVPSTIYAHWTPKNYNVTYDCGNGTLISGQSSTYSTTYDTNYSLASVASKCSYANHVVNDNVGTNNISGWVCRASGSNNYLNALSGVWQKDDNYTCVAQWKQNISYSCGSATTTTSIPNDQIAVGGSYSLVSGSNITNYCTTADTFSGWVCNYNLGTGASGDTIYDTSSLTGTFNAGTDVSCIAQWVAPAVQTYTITYYNGNTVYSPALTPGTYTPGSYITLPTPSRTNGYIFAGWCDGNNNCNDFSTTLMGTVDTTNWTGNKQLYAKWIEDKFQIVTTTESSAFDFRFVIETTGLFFVDWGDGNVQRIIDDPGMIAHSYAAGGSYTIRLGGQATPNVWSQYYGYYNTISFGGQGVDNVWTTPEKISSVTGSLGAIFGTMTGSNNSLIQPNFYNLFFEAVNLTSIPITLFDGVYGAPVQNMFYAAFEGCSSLTSLPVDSNGASIFRHIYGAPAEGMFGMTFSGTGLTSIPQNLFKGIPNDPVNVGIYGAPAEGMFSGTFALCSGLTSIPENLFDNIYGASATDMFGAAFAHSYLISYFTDSNGLQLKRRIRGVDNTPINYIPEDYMDGITTTGYSSGSMELMFFNTNLAEACPAGTYKRDVVFNTDWAPKVSCLICPADGDSNVGSTSIDACTYNIVYDGLQNSDTWLNNSPAPTTYTYGAGQTITGTPVRSGYRFVGYCTDQTRINCATTQTIAQHLTGTKTFYLKFEQIYDITYYDGSLDLGLSPSTYVPGDTAGLSLPSYTKPNYIFAGWCVDPNSCSDLTTTLLAGTQVPSTWTGDKTLRAKWVKDVFQIQTVPNTTSFDFKLNATGVFFVDWGDGTVERIQGTAASSSQQYSHVYATAGTYTIHFGSDSVTEYSSYVGSESTVVSVLGFTNASRLKISSASGSLGALFPTIGNGGTYTTQPRFSSVFANATNLTSVTPGLFSGLHGGAVPKMFSLMFSNCTSLTSINGLFNGVSQLTTSEYMFDNAFAGCSSLTSIPESLFANISGVPAAYMFRATFFGCNNLTSIPSGLFSTIVSDGIITNPGAHVFDSTFSSCTGVTEIDHNLFSTIQGTPAEYMFDRTFQNTGIRLIPKTLFNNLSGTTMTGMLNRTFSACSRAIAFADDNGNALTSYIPTDYMNNITPAANYNGGSLVSIFEGTQLLTQCPANMFKHNMDFDVDWAPKVSCEACPNNGRSPEGSTSINVCTYDINYVPLESGFTWTWQSNSTPPATYTYGSGATINSVPVHSGYVFDGYCTDSLGTSCSLTQTIAAQQSGTKTFYVKFHPVYNVTYDCNNGNAGGTAPTDSTDYAQGATVSVTQNGYGTCVVPSYANGFDYWKCSAGGVDYTDDVSDTSFTMPGADVTCTAQWDYNTHTITLHSGDYCDYPDNNLTHTDTVNNGGNYVLPSYGHVDDWPYYGCVTSNGWSFGATSTQSDYSNGATISNVTEDMDLYQVCTPKKWDAVYYPGTCSSSASSWYDDVYVYYVLPYTVTGPNSGASIDAYYGQSHTNNWIAPQNTPNVGGTIYPGAGQAFVGWDTDSSGTTVRYAEGDVYYHYIDHGCNGFNIPVKFYGVCVDAYSVSYRPNANSSVTYTESGLGVGTTHNLETDISVLNMTAPTGYHLDGWTCQTDATPAVSVPDTNNQITMPDANVICTAEWVLDEYHVTYDCNNGGLGTNPVDNTTYTIISSSATTPSQSSCLPPETGGRMMQTFWYCFSADESGQMIAGSNSSMIVPGDTLTVNENKYCMINWVDRNTTIVLNALTADNWTNKNIYGRYGYGAYLNAARTQLMSSSENFLPNSHIPQRTGYDFMGYYSSDQGNAAAPTGTQYIDATGVITSSGTDRAKTISSNDNWYAGWTPKSYTVTYLPGTHGTINLADNQYIHTDGATYNMNYSVPATVTSNTSADTGYTFVGWNTVSGQTVSTFPGNSETPWSRTNDVIVYAAYTPITYNINYNLSNGGTWNTGVSHPTTANYDEVFNVGAPSRTGYTFGSWNIGNMDSTQHNYGDNSNVSNSTSSQTISGTTATYFKNLTSVNDATVEFTAQWTANTHSISYDCGDATTTTSIPSTNNIAYGSSYNLLSNVSSNCTYTGHTFTGWECDYNLGTGVAENTTYTTSALSGTFNTDHDVECIAQWENNVSGAITLNDDYYKTSSLSENNPTYTATTAVNPDTLYSVYNTGIYDNLTDANAQTNALSFVNKPTLTGYDFQGFYTARQYDGSNVGTKVINSNGSFVTPTALTQVSGAGASATWYAKWTPKQYSVTYYPGLHGTGGYLDTVYYDTNYTVPSAANSSITENSGYTFRGWSFNQNDTYSSLWTGWTGESPWHTTSDVAVYAIYEPNEYTVSYYCDDVLTNSDTVVFGNSYVFSQPSICVKTGYTYGNSWVCENNTNNNIINQISNASSWAVSSNVTCTLTSQADEFNISYDANGGSYTGGYTAQTNVFGPGVSNGGGTYGQSWSLQSLSSAHITAPACYTFRGWSENSNTVYNGSNTLSAGLQSGLWSRTSDLSLYAIYSLNQHTVSYTCGSGTGTAPGNETQDCGETPVNLPVGQGNCVAPSATQEFDYWRCTGDTSGNILTSSDADTYFTMPDENVECAAQWKLRSYTITYHRASPSTGTYSGLTPTTYVTGDTGALPTPDQPDQNAYYIFLGWCEGNSNCSTSDTIYNIDSTWTGNKDLYAMWMTDEFQIDTVANTTSFQFAMSASGEFFIDWGDGTIERINRNETTYIFPSHNYASAGSYTIHMAGQATGYNTAISYNDSSVSFMASAAKVAAVRGSLGAIFGAVNGGGTAATQPRFTQTFHNCVNLQSVPAGLFSGVGGSPISRMFNQTFQNTGLTSVPAALFSNSGITGAPAEYSFAGTFMDCTSLQEIPATLFSSVSSNGTTTNPAAHMFESTFYGCTGLTSIPAGLFSSTRGTPADSMFASTFHGCTNLAPTQSNPNPVPETLFSSLDGAPAESLFYGTFGGCTGLTSIPANLFYTIHGAPARGMFSSTFWGCTNLQSIPSGLFGRISGAPAQSMFSQTFGYCTSIEEIPSGLFSGISGPAASYMFNETFENCTSLETIPNRLFGTLSGTADNMFNATFKNCTSIETIPEDVFGGVSGTPSTSMFNATFEGCTSLTSIPSGLFNGISGTPAQNMFYATFRGCTGLTSIPEDLFDGISGQSARSMFYETFRNCSNVQYFTDSNNQQVKATINGTPTSIYYIPADYMEDISETNFALYAMRNMFTGTGLVQACPAGTTLRNTVFYTSGWTPKVSCVPTYTLTYDCNNGNAGGTVPAAATTYGSETSITVETTNNTCNVPSGAQGFGYWLCAGDTSNNALTSSSNATFNMPYENVTCSAQWEYVNHTITYIDSVTNNTYSNFPASAYTYIEGSTDALPIPTTQPVANEHRIFMGWCDGNSNCTSSNTIFNIDATWTTNKTLYAMWMTTEFEVDTVSNTDSFAFHTYASGEFFIDWGDGTVERFTNSTTDYRAYTHNYASAGTYTIRMAGQATGYNASNNVNAIGFYTSRTKISAVRGSLGSIFSAIGAGGTTATQPRFTATFEGCTNLQSIPSGLFNGIGGSSVLQMFRNTFKDCTSLTSLPNGLFNGITTGAPIMFLYTFYGCTGLTSIPSDLFNGFTTGDDSMFSGTFKGCTSLTTIPSSFVFFANNVNGVGYMFQDTFYGCTSLTTIPSGMFNRVTGSASALFNGTFGNSGLTSIPYGLFSNFTTGANSMFSETFKGCTGLTSIPENLFANISGTPADFMFYQTFYGCSNIEYFADNSGNQLTEVILGDETEINYIPKNFMLNLEDPNYSSTYDQWSAYQMFNGTQLATSCPMGTSQRNSVFNDDWSPKVSCIPDIYLIWNADGGELGNASNNTNSCAYGTTTGNGAITTINAPAPRTGYTFTGWRVTDWTDGTISNGNGG